MKKITFIVDAPGWSTDSYAKRVISRIDNFECEIFYVAESLADLFEGKQNQGLRILPESDAYYFCSWWWLYQYMNNGSKIDGKVFCDFVDDYSWVNFGDNIKAILGKSEAIFSQSLEFCKVHTESIFHEFPYDKEFLKHKRNHIYGKDFKIGMIGNRAIHSSKDHKGVDIVKEILKDLPIDIEVAGRDVYIEYQDLPAWYDSLDLYLCASVSESFSSATVDALTLGCPAMSTPVTPCYPFVSLNGYIPIPSRSTEKDRFESFLKNAFMRFDSKDANDRAVYAKSVVSEWECKAVTECLKKYLG